MTGLQDRTALVTGGTDGIGKEIASGLALEGMRVMVVGRDVEKGVRAAEQLRQRAGNEWVEFVSADLSLMSECARLADQITARWPRVHYLVHSAGIIRGRWELTSEGIESNFAVNYLSRFTLTNRLLPWLEAAARPGDPARIAIVGGGAQIGKIHFGDVNLTGRFNTGRAVLQFQCANDIFTLELSRRLEAPPRSRPVTVNIIKYGPVKSNILREAPRWLHWFSAIAGPLVGQTAAEAAGPALRLLLHPDFAGASGGLFQNTSRFRRIAARPYVADRINGVRLWELSEKLSAHHESGVRRA